MTATVALAQPTVTRLRVVFSHDPHSAATDIRTRFHWVRFGREVEIDDSDYVSPHRDGYHSRRKFDYDDEKHPIYKLQPGARLVIESNSEPGYRTGEYPTALMLEYLKQDARRIRRWLQDEWHYVTVVLEATVTVDASERTYTRTERESIGGVEVGIGESQSEYAAEHVYHAEIVSELTAELKARLTADGILWPDGLETPTDHDYE
jgi:hypothetical protein